uniref:peptide chain release factor N(5)-glutamine methyltransferase n=1 Tax=Thaumasiovibrio occultus TaxID=1891184 RepID=UPI000B35FCCB|nr:peptide chain release factor N(5)-glutamine methyltransferase [Thaumasiovibrio occultus]
MQIAQWLQTTQLQLAASGSPSPAIDAEVLLLHVLQQNRSYLFTWPDKVLDDAQLAQLSALVERRQNGEPVAYITGSREFWSLNLAVSPATLIPRPDTELLVELALAALPPSHATILDLGTGTGAIALAIGSERPDCKVIGVDIQPDAVALATQNGQTNGVSNCEFLPSSWFSALTTQRFELIVSNPPYIDPQDPHLSQGDVRFEPLSALIAEDKGMADIQHIATESRGFLLDGGWLMFEHGYDQGLASRQCLSALGYVEVETKQDYAGHDRVTLGRWKG